MRDADFILRINQKKPWGGECWRIGKKIGVLLLLFEAQVKNEHFRSMFVTCACPGLKPIEFGKCFPSKMHWGHIHFHRDQGMTLALMGQKFWNSLNFFWNILTKSIWKKKRTTKPWSYNTIWPTYFLACFGYGVWWNEFCYMLSHFLKNVFLQCRCYQGWFQYPSSWKPQAQLEKIGVLLLLFEAQVKNEHFRSMFVTCACPGLKPIEFGKCVPSKMHWGHIHFHRDQGVTLALMGKFWNSVSFFEIF